MFGVKATRLISKRRTAYESVTFLDELEAAEFLVDGSYVTHCVDECSITFFSKGQTDKTSADATPLRRVGQKGTNCVFTLGTRSVAPLAGVLFLRSQTGLLVRFSY